MCDWMATLSKAQTKTVKNFMHGVRGFKALHRLSENGNAQSPVLNVK